MFRHGAFHECSLYNFCEKGRQRKTHPFEVSADPFYSAENIAELERRVANVKNGTSTLKEHDLIEVQD